MRIINIAALLSKCQSEEDLDNLLLSNKDWHVRYAAAQELLKEAGWKENMATGLMAAILMVMSGATPAEAAKAKNVDIVQLERALKTFKPKIQRNKQRTQQMDTLQKNTNPLPAVNASDISSDELFQFISGNEGYRTKAYLDPSKKNISIGVGCNIDRPEVRQIIEKEFKLNYNDVRSGKKELTATQIKRLFDIDVEAAIKAAKGFVNNYDKLPTAMKKVLVDMSFNMGAGGLSQFKNFKTAIEQLDFQTAAKELTSSKWYAQTKNRAKRSVELVANLTTPKSPYETLAQVPTKDLPSS